jgi:hypothetical protein
MGTEGTAGSAVSGHLAQRREQGFMLRSTCRRQENGFQFRRVCTIAIHAPRDLDQAKVTHGRDRVVGTMLRGPLPTYSVVDKHAMSFLGLIEVLTSWLFDLT